MEVDESAVTCWEAASGMVSLADAPISFDVVSTLLRALAVTVPAM